MLSIRPPLELNLERRGGECKLSPVRGVGDTSDADLWFGGDDREGGALAWAVGVLGGRGEEDMETIIAAA